MLHFTNVTLWSRRNTDHYPLSSGQKTDSETLKHLAQFTELALWWRWNIGKDFLGLNLVSSPLLQSWWKVEWVHCTIRCIWSRQIYSPPHSIIMHWVASGNGQLCRFKQSQGARHSIQCSFIKRRFSFYLLVPLSEKDCKAGESLSSIVMFCFDPDVLAL